MPLLGIFSRKQKSRTSKTAGAEGAAGQTASIYSSTASELESASACTSPNTEYVSADKSLPSSPNGKSNLSASSDVYPSIVASSSKLRLPFTRKKASAAASTTSLATTSHAAEYNTPPRPSYVSRTSTSVASDSDAPIMERRHLRPPPSKSAIFAAYADPNGAFSTRSLPNPNERISRTEPPSPPPPVPPKRSIFPWSKSASTKAPPPNDPTNANSKVKPKSSPNTVNITPSASGSPHDTENSFNLMAFRHIRSPSPSHTTSSVVSLTPPVPPGARPRGTSITSESSQRISVAAFREAQARRSLAGSPVPSFRSPSPRVPATGQKGYVGEGSRSSSHLHPQHAHSSPHVSQRNINARGSSAFTTDSESASSSSEEDSDEEHGRLRQSSSSPLGRRSTITQRNSSKELDTMATVKGRAKSELGHGNSSLYDSPQSRRMDFSPSPSPSPRPQPNVGPNRQRASVSTSALTPTAAAQRASVLAAANGNSSSETQRNSRHAREPSSYSTPTAKDEDSDDSDSDSDSDSDDAPLATLLPPRRPGSAMSSASGSRPHTPTRPPLTPLIDIKALTKPDAVFTAPKSSDHGFTPGATLISSRGMIASSSSSAPAAAARSPPSKFVSPPSSPGEQPSRFVSSPTSTTSGSSGSGSGFSNAAQMGGVSPAILKSAMKSVPGRKGTTSPPPMRRDTSSPLPQRKGTDTSVLSGSTSGSSVGPPDRRRDMISERLSKVVQQNVRTASPVQNPNISASNGSTERPLRQHRRTSSDVVSSTAIGVHEEDGAEDRRATVVGGIRLVGGMANDEGKAQAVEEKKEERIAPIPIKQRAPPPSFSVISRPQHNPNSVEGGRPRSSTLMPVSTSSSSFGTSIPTGSSNNSSANADRVNALKAAANPGARQRSTTMMPVIPISPSPMFPMPTKPFATRRESPASSTGDSSITPLTPRDGSDLGSVSVSGNRGNGRHEGKEEWSGGVSGLGLGAGNGKGHSKRRSVSFEEQREEQGGGKSREKSRETPGEGETRRKERRRSEARAAIELGNVINGRGPIVDDDEDDEDDDHPINQTLGGRMSMMNPMMGMGGPLPMSMGFGGSPAGSPGWNNMAAWQQRTGSPMLSPAQFMLPQPTDPNFFAAHQQAMMIAKQAYQMAVAQQAMAAAGDEWERGSNVGGFGGGSVYGGVSPPASQYGASMGMGMGGMGMSGGGNGWGNSSMMFSGGPQSMYGGSGARSEYGGGGGNGSSGWGSKSVYGESFGPSGDRFGKGNSGQSRPGYGQRESGYFGGAVPPLPQGQDGSGRGTSRSRTASVPASPIRTAGQRKAPPPSSWKAGV